MQKFTKIDKVRLTNLMITGRYPPPTVVCAPPKFVNLAIATQE
ncbi:MAG TPA: hypothetical protein V6D14_19330 [Coleofasciculaceae cyanobacterium]